MTTPRKYALLLSYVGTPYCGWQKQRPGAEADDRPSIQSLVEAALRQVTSEPQAKVVGSGRTDSGVHAQGQVIHCVLGRREWDPENLRRGLNSQLPPTIRALAAKEVALDFHAQRSAVKKQYSYYFQQGPAPLPAWEPYSWWIQKRLDLPALNSALGHLTGEHDFKPFRAAGAKPGPSVRRILEAEAVWEELPFPQGVLGESWGLVRVRLVGTGFLKQMVRGIAGTLLQVGEGRRSPDCIQEILASQDRQKVGPTAPARALWLERVWYDSVDFGSLFRLQKSDYGT